MEALLKKCYKETGILGANALTYENRCKTILRISEQEEITEESYHLIARWLMGEVFDETEECLTFLEKNFCMEDKEFSIKDEKEMQVLVAIILLNYCLNKEEVTIALRILCGHGIEMRLPCVSLYHKFLDVVENSRIKCRKIETTEGKIKSVGIKGLKTSIAESRKDLSDEEYQYTTEQLDMLINIIEIQEQNIKTLEKKKMELQDQVACQREESDVLWWMINEWSHTYKKAFSEMSAEEMAIAIPLELNNNSEYNLLPYSAERIVSNLFHKFGKDSVKKCLSDYIEYVSEDIAESLDMNETRIEKVQPILGSFCCIRKCGCEAAAWKGMLNKKYGSNADGIVLTPIEFANHFCLELELQNYLQ